MSLLNLDSLSPDRREALVRRIRLLVVLTIAYNMVEAVVALVAGMAASSTALVGFGLDSVVEVSSAAAVAWQFAAVDHATREHREQIALRIIAASFVGLALLVASTLHAVATGNLLPATVPTVCVDVNPSVPTKLADRGSFQAVGLVMDAASFLKELARELGGGL